MRFRFPTSWFSLCLLLIVLALGGVFSLSVQADVYDNSTSARVPRAGTGGSNSNADITNSTINVPSFTGTLNQVRVAVDITHPFVGDLTLGLIGPDNTRVALSNRRGGSGDNYTNTGFYDGASTAIKNGAAPFDDAYRPEEPLSKLVGHQATGTWTLQIVDKNTGDSGTLNSWSLYLYNDIPQDGPTFTVNSTDDSDDGVCGVNKCTLRDAINAANWSYYSQITFDTTLFATPQTINLTEPLPDVLSSVEIKGPGAKLLTVNAGNFGILYSDVYDIGLPEPSFSLSGIKFTGGGDPDDASNPVFDLEGITHISGCEFSDNFTPTNTSLALTMVGFGAIDIENSTFAGGGTPLVAYGTLNLTNTTISENESGLVVLGYSLANLSSVTIANNNEAGVTVNSGGFGGPFPYNAATLNIKNSIIANNNATEQISAYYKGNEVVVNSGGHNIVSDESLYAAIISSRQASKLSQARAASPSPGYYGDFLDTDPLLAPLADNGGPTRTCDLLPGSLARDTAADTGLATDQRGIARPLGTADDIGAVEANPVPTVSLSLSPLAPATNDIVTATATDKYFDTPPTYSYEWLVNGNSVQDGASNTLDLSVPGQGDKDDIITCIVTATNATQSANTSRDVTVTASLPSVDVPSPSYAFISAPSAALPDGLPVIYRHNDGSNLLTRLQVMVNYSNKLANGLIGRYDVASNNLYLLSDAGNQWLGPISAGSGATLSNSSGILRASTTSIITSAQTITVKWGFEPNESRRGTNPIRAFAQDSFGKSSDVPWTLLGTWKVQNLQTPTVDQASPAINLVSTAGEWRTFSLTFRDGDGSIDLTEYGVEINQSNTRANATVVSYLVKTHSFRLLGDTAGTWLTTPDGDGIISNSSGAVDTTGSTVTDNGDGSVTVLFKVRQSANSLGKNAIRGYAIDRANLNSIKPNAIQGYWQVNAAASITASRRKPTSASAHGS